MHLNMRHQASGLFVAGSVVALAIAGCSSGTSGSNSSASSTSTTGAAAVNTATAVVVDGQNQSVNGAVSCTTSGDNITIAVGDATTGVGAIVTTANPPIVHSVGLGNVNGVMFGYSDAATGQGNVQATLNGKTYDITGTATGVDTANPQQPVSKSFELRVTCP